MLNVIRTLTDVENEIHQHLDSGRTQLQGAAKDARRIGELLIEGKELLPHGEFIPWATARFGFHRSHVHRLMANVSSGDIQSGALLLPDSTTINPGLMSSNTAEWYTPVDIARRAETALGGIDLDPCSNSHTAPQVPAKLHYTQADNGLELPWAGAVYMNPPYGAEIGQWAERLVAQWRVGSVTAAIALVPARTDTAWFQTFRDGAICFIRGRLKFSESENSAPFPSAAVYLGSDKDGFAAAFAEIGDVWTRL